MPATRRAVRRRGPDGPRANRENRLGQSLHFVVPAEEDVTIVRGERPQAEVRRLARTQTLAKVCQRLAPHRIGQLAIEPECLDHPQIGRTKGRDRDVPSAELSLEGRRRHVDRPGQVTNRQMDAAPSLLKLLCEGVRVLVRVHAHILALSSRQHGEHQELGH
jgi:hypothetical protein